MEMYGFDDVITILSFTLTLITTCKLMSLVACAVVAATRVDAEMLTQRYASTAFIFLCEYTQTNHQNQTLERKSDPLLRSFY